MRILGIDPGLRKTGFGLIDVVDGKSVYHQSIQKNQPIQYVCSGIIETDASLTLPQRLKTIGLSVQELILEYQPDIAVCEIIFLNSNPKSTLLLGQARGAAITAAGISGIEVIEYTALQIKKTVVGYGHADKTQVEYMVQNTLKLQNPAMGDAADALATALCYVYSR